MQYAVITGASQGIGKAIAEKLLAQGCPIAVCARDRNKLRTVVEEWRNTYTDADIIWTNADLGTEKGVEELAALVLGSFPQIDILVNNAGTFATGLLAEEPEDMLDKMLQVNLYAAYRLSRKLLPQMKQQGSGHIFNMCSIASLKAYAGIGAYSISKYALLGLTDNLREELRSHGIKVTAICPGSTWSPSWEGSDTAPERIMEAGDIAEMIWAASRLSPQAVAETIVMRPVKGDL
ncbi:SDR family oxidoreductase [Nemorincola caseinilytica]|uniref:SDR family oxidoreductase n=1 Tax=Nemorincola caseinilytica TaxID=2054315 RepID=A0ABP8N1V7_9BACT